MFITNMDYSKEKVVSLREKNAKNVLTKYIRPMTVKFIVEVSLLHSNYKSQTPGASEVESWYRGFKNDFNTEYTLSNYKYSNGKLEITAKLKASTVMRIRARKESLKSILETIADPDEDGNYPITYKGVKFGVMGSVGRILSISYNSPSS